MRQSASASAAKDGGEGRERVGARRKREEEHEGVAFMGRLDRKSVV